MKLPINMNTEANKQIFSTSQKPKPFKIALIILVGMIVIAGTIGGLVSWQKKEVKPQPPSPQPPTTQPPITQPPSVSAELAAAKHLIKPENIILEKSGVIPNIPSYSLPLNLNSIANWSQFSEKIQLSSEAKSLLEKNGFVVIQTPKDIAEHKIFNPLSPTANYAKDDFAAYYEMLKNKDLPVFITTDSLLHYYHIFFDVTLLRMERDIFYDDLWQMSKELLDDAKAQYEASEGGLKEAVKRNVAYFSVALELLKPRKNQIATKENLKEEINCYDPCCEKFFSEQLASGKLKLFKFFTLQEAEKYKFEPPSYVKDLVDKEIALIEAHQGWDYSPIFVYQEDYSQYVPRGHYTKSEKLKNYFKAMMWYGRMTALIKGSPILHKGESLCTGEMNGIISEYDAKIQTLQASLIANKFSQSKVLQERWNRIYTITSFFVGFSDDLGPYEYSAVLKSLFEEGLTAAKIEEKYLDIRDALLNLSYNPKIYGGLGACELSMPSPPLSDEEIQALKLQAQKLLEETKGFRFMGQRFTVDSWLFSEIVSPYSGEYTGNQVPRPFTWVKTATGREVRGFPRGLDIMALFGSERAKEILTILGDTQYSDYEEKFSELKKEVDNLPQEEWFKNIYWNWLYTLKSLLGEFGNGYQTFMTTKAWQDKELNTALASWAELRHDTILYVKQSYTMAEMGASPEEVKIVGYVEPIPEFYQRLLNLTRMTKSGLNHLLTKDQLANLYINDSLDRLDDILTKLLEISEKELKNQSLSDEEYNFIKNFDEFSTRLIKAIAGQGDIDQDVLKSVLVADVHTDGNTKKVLEEGVGYIKTLVAAYKLPEGHLLLGVGPVFSYYEFKQPMENRLTDEAWRQMLETNPPPEPEWIKSFSE